MKKSMVIALAGVAFFLLPHGMNAYAQTHEEIFIRFIGPEAALDEEIRATVLADRHGKRHFFDTNDDGAVETMYFIDTDERHGDSRQPLLVKVIDEDGDMDRTREPDTDSDLYIADWYGDGSVDRAIDYHDIDGDGDVDEQYLYQWSESGRARRAFPDFDGERSYLVAWAKDYGDDNRLWYHTNYEYGQRITQWKTDFNGDEMFVYLFFFDYDDDRLIPMWENAFSFYDLDDDQLSEEVVRFTGTGTMSETLRYSMDIDNDSRGENRHDYDFSISGIGDYRFPPEFTRRVIIRGHETEPIMKWENMREAGKTPAWTKLHLTWDENDNNVDPLRGRMHNERWEGVLNHGNDYMPQVGGPSGGPVNKRNEVDGDASGGLSMYLSPVDDRLHLYGAEIGWLDADYDFNGTVDLRFEMEDTDGNGYFDTWRRDADGDGTFEWVTHLDDDACTIIPFDYDALHAGYNERIAASLDKNERIIDALKEAVSARNAGRVPVEIDIYFTSSLARYDEEFGQGRKIHESPEGRRYYLELIRERYWLRYAELFSSEEHFTAAKRAYAMGEFNEAARIIEKGIDK